MRGALVVESEEAFDLLGGEVRGPVIDGEDGLGLGLVSILEPLQVGAVEE